MDQFVCVRLIQVWGADLSLFQYDGDLTMATFFINPDKTIYGRYGSRSGGNANAEVSLEGFKKAAAGALELHQAYPGNKKALAGKTGATPKWKTPETLPTLAGKHNPGDLTDSKRGCIHCHQIHDNQIRSSWTVKQGVTDALLWKYPMPDDLGFHLSPDERAKVVTVSAGSPAEKAGFLAGDTIRDFEGQPMLSIADVQWVLHTAPDSGQLKARVDRGGKEVDLTLPLAAGWRRKGEFLYRRHAWTLQSQVVGMNVEPLKPEDRQKANLKEGVLALRVTAIGTNARSSPSASRAGMQKDDIIIGVDGKNAELTVSEWMAYIFEKKAPGQKVVVTIQRNGITQSVDLVLIPSDL